MSKRFFSTFGCLILIALLASACQTTIAVAVTKTPIVIPATITPTPVPLPQPLWSFQTGAAIWGTPAISDGTVDFGSDDGNLYAVEAQTGSLTWKFTTQGIVRSQPAIAGGLVYFASDDGYLYAIEAQSGTQAWRTDIGNILPREVREKLGTDANKPAGWDYKQSSPIVVDGRIYVGSLDGNVYALAADTGHVSWTYTTGSKVRATPTVDNGALYVGSWDESFYALDALTGQLRWKTPVGGEVQSTALVADGLVYTASRKASVVALDAQTGETRWEYSYGVNMWVESSPILVNGIIYIGSAGDKWIMGLDSQIGEAFTTYYSKVWHLSTPAIVDDMLYIGGAGFKGEGNIGGLYGFVLGDGKFTTFDKVQWYCPVAEKSLEAEGNWSGVFSSPVVGNGIIYFGGLDGKLYAVSIGP